MTYPKNENGPLLSLRASRKFPIFDLGSELICASCQIARRQEVNLESEIEHRC
jgi:hypothetical protein